jgi:[acyl-carrier-protein] S-malonyltransferase
MTIAFIFPGQGSQSVGMLNAFAQMPSVQKLMQNADSALGEPLSAMIQTGPAEALSLTVNTQPAMLLAGIACLTAWQESAGAQAHMYAGHSLGEYTALCAAGSLSFEDSIRLVRLRAQAMQEAVPVGTGAMAAILGLSDEAVAQACAQASLSTGRIVEPANFNAPAQVVISGHSEAVSAACEIAKNLGAKRALQLPVSAPFHSSLLKSAGERLSVALSRITLTAPRAPLVNNIDARVATEPVQIADALVRQSYGPVRWVEVMQALEKSGVTRVIEFGPGKVLTGLTKRICPDMKASAVFDQASLDAALVESL